MADTFDETNARGILDYLLELVASSDREPDNFEEAEGDDASADARVSWGENLYTVSIKRV